MTVAKVSLEIVHTTGNVMEHDQRAFIFIESPDL